MVVVLYKIISKLLSIRLKIVKNELIDQTQTLFVDDRHIMDGVMIVN